MSAFAQIPVEELRPGDEVELPNARIVQIESVDVYPPEVMAERYYGERLVVRWASGPIRRPPDPNAGQRKDLGSLVPMERGETVRARRDPEPEL